MPQINGLSFMFIYMVFFLCYMYYFAMGGDVLGKKGS
uniref:ATPase subunit 8 n=1 Tax=Halocynthia spinosa TaxID=569430 RepID=S0DF22_HALSF|nr:ATP synthase F0 subunit 8 [Halocynthia spinosa]CCO25770.1 ATPase subunit 8 [Halocynthia spinosa]